MKIQLNGYEASIDRMYTYKAYAGSFGGRIDSRINDKEEKEAREELKSFSYVENSNLYLSPHRGKAPMSSFHPDVQEVIEEDYLEGRYDTDNFPEKDLAEYWVFLELVSYDHQFKKYEDGFSTGLNVACNIQDIDIFTIEKYLYAKVPAEIWNCESVDYTP